MKDIEKRTLVNLPCELRAAHENGPATIVGYGATFNARSSLLFGSFYEEVAPGAFDDVMNDDVRALFNHDPNFVLGRTVSGTLSLSLDSRGLAYTITPPDTQTVRDMVLAPLQRGDVSGSSFRFRVAADGDEWRREGDMVVRTIHRFGGLLDVSPVTYPAYGDSYAAQRSLEAWQHADARELAGKAISERRARERFLDLINLI
ncbi:HK97 family phage prohead protease [Alcaligenes endophyticus]|uniref:HK97 family phage prohead protease n=1 Tax=Alcaligenes endophyticus TaxID=1929088 RepID=A0ABT8ENH0_9BURK|nr:HK97 family phage prohead protease [Alcaligenes endophyticus]MCX5592804.1 HK97 family phage prohead protease [Alcaligenes endophyticus]MDN4122846.1 HK97 family phage prohead protease [Alcaligenes endophyticus]